VRLDQAAKRLPGNDLIHLRPECRALRRFPVLIKPAFENVVCFNAATINMGTFYKIKFIRESETYADIH